MSNNELTNPINDNFKDKPEIININTGIVKKPRKPRSDKGIARDKIKDNIGQNTDNIGQNTDNIGQNTDKIETESKPKLDKIETISDKIETKSDTIILSEDKKKVPFYKNPLILSGIVGLLAVAVVVFKVMSKLRDDREIPQQYDETFVDEPQEEFLEATNVFGDEDAES